MPILVKEKSPPTTVQCVSEVRVGVPCELLVELRDFYVQMLGLRPWPEEMQIPGGWGAGNPRRGLYLQFRHDPEVDPVRRRFTLLVDSLASLAQRLVDREWAHDWMRGFGWTDQCILLRDPVGHLVEVRQAQAL